MTMTPPVVNPVTLDPSVVTFRAPADIQPFSYRDTDTYLTVLNNMRRWLYVTLVPFLNTNFEDLQGGWEDNVQALDDTINAALAQQATNINNALTAQQQQVVDALQTTLNQITSGENAALNDSAVYQALITANGQALAFLDNRYNAKYALASAVASSISALTASINANGTAISGINGTLAGRLADAALQNEFGDAAIASLIASPSAATGISFRRRLGVFVDDYGTVADGTTDDTTAIQNALTAANGGTVYFGVGRTYCITDALVTFEGSTLDFRGATIKKKYKAGTNIYSTFVNHHSNASGYGKGSGNVTFKNGTITGDYTSATKIDVSISLLHADYVAIENMTFTQGNQNGHYVDLGGCRFVNIKNCKFLGGNPTTGAEQKEAIQIDVATRDGSSNYAGANPWPSTVYDGLPTRHVKVKDCTFLWNDIYPMPNPVGSHSAALTTDAGYFENITFEDNTCEGWTNPPAQGATLAYGWVHFRGTRALRIVGNTFRDVGNSGRSGYPTIIHVSDAPAVTAEADTNTVGATATTLGTTRYGYDTVIEGNWFGGLNNTPATAGKGHIQIDNTVNASVIGNEFDVVVAPAIQVNNEGTVDDLVIEDNKIRAGSYGGDLIYVVNTVASAIQNNRIHMGTATAQGVHDSGGDSNLIQGNTFSGGSTAVLIDTSINDAVIGNSIRNPTAVGISIGATGAAGTTADTLVASNRVKTTTSGAKGLVNGTGSTRLRQYGNHWNAPTPTADTGASTVASAWSS